ncbi:hypothetical protein UFOVP903_22 [uncultured Caudovirales phage]|uniref:Uncharacterized protein n=1 Tax=uncultured Caudovirales phage TaxID=2100421 RepID=A0A6J5PKS7_9CAUD|nr:hypothetical protein UFOVP903_22 [uncultured Caudovirales phage]CAB4197584.1 hypothetical protein UFOVP1318_24 [uncultured Caudovirales phage]CAB4210493.1 hypothetical protein UFOVP1430_20 [uncultured Caudovirales phage]
MPTVKQVRYHYKKVDALYTKLARALNEAHAAEVLVYADYVNESPCKLLFESEDRFNKTTEKQLADALRYELRTEKPKK